MSEYVASNLKNVEISVLINDNNCFLQYSVKDRQLDYDNTSEIPCTKFSTTRIQWPSNVVIYQVLLCTEP